MTDLPPDTPTLGMRMRAFNELADEEQLMTHQPPGYPEGAAVLKALAELRDALPAECSCHQSYREREKNLGYRFKDPDCLYCDIEDELKAANSAIDAATRDR